MAVELGGYEWERNETGESGGTVYRLFGKTGARDLFLKHGKGTVADQLLGEVCRLRWLAGFIQVPVVTHFVALLDEAWMLMTALPGTTAYQVLETRPDERAAVVNALATFLRRLHAIPTDRCPFNAGHLYRLNQARQRIDAGLVDEDDFDEEREGWSAEQVWRGMQRLLPLHSDPVVTHGDFSLDNVLMVDGAVVGCIDVGRAVADRWQDLAILWNSLGEFDGPLREELLARYGVAEADERSLQFHLMLDEFF